MVNEQGPALGFITWLISLLEIMNATACTFCHGAPVNLGDVSFVFLLQKKKKKNFFSKHFKTGLEKRDKPCLKTSNIFVFVSTNGLNGFPSILMRELLPSLIFHVTKCLPQEYSPEGMITSMRAPCSE